MGIRRILYFCSFILVLVVIYGCPSINKTYPERTFFLFELTTPDQVSQVKGTSVDVNRFTISPRSQGREFIYRTSDLEFKNDFYNQFFRPPDNIVTEAVRDWINQSGLFEDVLTPASQALPEYVIEGNIIDLYGDYRDESAAKAVMRIQLFLLRLSEDGSNPTILLSTTYDSVQSIGTASPNALMQGWNLALEDILSEFLTDLSYSLKQSQQQSSDSTN